MKFPLSLDFTLESERLQLRAPREEDIPYIFEATRVKGFNDGMQWEPPFHPDELLPPLNAHLGAWVEGTAFGFAIEDRSTGEFLGRISIRPTQEENCWDIGYWTHPKAQGKGIMTEAVATVLTFAYEELQVTEVVAAYAVWNKASQRVLEKNGFVYLSHLPKGFQKHGKGIAETLMIRRKQ